MSIILFAARQAQKMAQEIIDIGRGSIVPGTIKWDRYDGVWANTVIENAESLRNRDVAFLAAYETMADIIEQQWALNTLTRRYKVRSMKMLLLDYPTGTKDRWEEEGEVVTAFELADGMGTIAQTKSGPIDLGIFDLHALQEESYFPKNFRPPDRLSAMPLLCDMIGGYDDISIVFPDEGAYKRYAKRNFKGFDQVVCEKRRIGKDRIVTIKEGDPKGRHCYIVDDRIISGVTAVKCKDALFSAGAAAVSLYVGHGAFTTNAPQKFIDSGFSEVWFSDSCPAMAEKLRGVGQFKIMPLAHEAANWILEDTRQAA